MNGCDCAICQIEHSEPESPVPPSRHGQHRVYTAADLAAMELRDVEAMEFGGDA